LSAQIFEEIWRSVESRVIQLLESGVDQSNLILDELRSLSKKIDELWACRLVDCDDLQSCSGRQGEDKVDMQGPPSTQQIFDVSPENLETELTPSSSASTRGHTTEIDDVDMFSQAANKPGLSAHGTAYSAEMNTSLSKVKPRQLLGVQPSQPTPTAIPTDVMDSQPLPFEHDAANGYIMGNSTEEQTEQSKHGLASSNENLDESESSSNAQMQELPFSNEHPLPLIISDQAQSPMSRGEYPSRQTPEEQSQPDANYQNGNNRTDTYDGLTKTQSIELVEQGAAEGIQSERRMLRPRNMHSSIMYAPEQQQAKRKPSEQSPGTRTRKRLKSQSQIVNVRPTSLKELECIPQDIIPPTEVCQKLVSRCGNVDEGALWLLVRLFYAIASPDAFSQLRDACALVREKGEFTVSQQTDTVVQTIRALDGLETAASTNAILRRYHLTRLVEHRNEKEYLIAQTGRTSNRSKSKNTRIEDSSHANGQAGFGRISSMALSSLMAEAYPNLEQPSRLRNSSGTEYKKKYKSLKNMLGSGRNWDLMQQKFSPGILALIPTGGEYGIQNYE